MKHAVGYVAAAVRNAGDADAAAAQCITNRPF